MFTFPAADAAATDASDSDETEQQADSQEADDREVAVNSTYSSPSFTAVSRQSSTADSSIQPLPVIEEDSQSSPSIAGDVQPAGSVPPLEAANGAQWSMFAETEDVRVTPTPATHVVPEPDATAAQHTSSHTDNSSATEFELPAASPTSPSTFRSLFAAAASGLMGQLDTSKQQHPEPRSTASPNYVEDDTHSYSPTASYHTADREDSTTSQQLSFGTPQSMTMQPSSSPVPLTSARRVSPTMQHYSIAEYIPDNVLAIADTTASSLGFKSISNQITDIRQHKAADEIVTTNASNGDLPHHQPIIHQINGLTADLDAPNPAPATSTPTNIRIPNVPQPTTSSHAT